MREEDPLVVNSFLSSHPFLSSSSDHPPSFLPKIFQYWEEVSPILPDTLSTSSGMAVSLTSGRSLCWSPLTLKNLLPAVASLLVILQLVRHRSDLKSAWGHASAEGGSVGITLDPKVKNAGNSTMGVEKIIVVNMLSRGDRRDRMSLLAAHTGIDIEYSDGVKGDEVDSKAVPPHWDTGKNMSPGNLGSYRSHIVALRRIVEQGYRTAMIMEDDLDWDLGIKDQLRLFATHLRSISSSESVPLSQQAKHKTADAPYGLGWDIIWLGTCMRPDPPPNTYSYRDPFSEEITYLWNNKKDGVACTHAYVLTYESAKAILAYALDLNVPWDVHLANFCRAHVCPLPSPPIIGFHQPAGLISKGSDISTNNPTEVREKAITIGVKHSALLDVTNNVEPKTSFPPVKIPPQPKPDKNVKLDQAGAKGSKDKST